MSKKITVEEMESLADEQREMVSCNYCRNNNNCNNIQETGICRLYSFNKEKWRSKEREL